MKIKIPGHGPVTIYSDTGQSISVPGDGPVEVSEVAAAVPAGGYVGTAMQFENGDVMLYENGDVMIYE